MNHFDMKKISLTKNWKGFDCFKCVGHTSVCYITFLLNKTHKKVFASWPQEEYEASDGS